MRYDTYSLKKLLSDLTQQFPEITDIYIFGSRRHRTLSTRSDLDMLLVAKPTLRSEDVRDFTLKNCPFLDCFIVDRSVATSCANGSKVRGRSRSDLIYRLDGLNLWNKSTGFSNADVDWDFQVIKGFTPILTSLVSESPMPSKAEAITTVPPKETEAHGRSRWRDVATHPISIIAATGVVIAGIVFAVIHETRIIPLEREVEGLRQQITAKKPELPKNNTTTSQANQAAQKGQPGQSGTEQSEKTGH